MLGFTNRVGNGATINNWDAFLSDKGYTGFMQGKSFKEGFNPKKNR